MAGWLIYLIVSGCLGIFLLWTAYLKKYRRVGVMAVIVLLLIATPTISLQQVSAANDRAERAEAQKVIDAFKEKYVVEGQEFNKIVNASKVEVYVITRGKVDENGLLDTSDGVRQSILIGGKWLEINPKTDE